MSQTLDKEPPQAVSRWEPGGVMTCGSVRPATTVKSGCAVFKGKFKYSKKPLVPLPYVTVHHLPYTMTPVRIFN